MNTVSWKGYMSVTTAAILWASCGTVGKVLFNAGLSPFILVQTRVTLAAAILLIAFILFRPSLLRIKFRDTGHLMLFGGFFLAIMQLSYFMAISRIHVAAAILLQYLAPSMVACYSFIFWKERVTPLKLAALVMSLIGCYLVVGGFDITLLKLNRAGIAWGLISALAFASTTLLGEKVMHRYNPWTALTYGLLFSSLSLNIVHRPLSVMTQSFTLVSWAAVCYIVIIGTLIPFGLYLTGVNYIRSTRTIITATLEPIAAAFLAFFLLGEAFAPLQIAGGITVLAAIILLQREREQDELSPEAIRSRSTDQGEMFQG